MAEWNNFPHHAVVTDAEDSDKDDKGSVMLPLIYRTNPKTRREILHLDNREGPVKLQVPPPFRGAHLGTRASKKNPYRGTYLGDQV